MLFDQYLRKSFKNKGKSTYKDSKFKSIAKAISWRTLGTIDTIAIAYFVTGEVSMAISIGSIEVFSKILLYYFHERIWERATIKKQINETERKDTSLT